MKTVLFLYFTPKGLVILPNKPGNFLLSRFRIQMYQNRGNKLMQTRKGEEEQTAWDDVPVYSSGNWDWDRFPLVLPMGNGWDPLRTVSSKDGMGSKIYTGNEWMLREAVTQFSVVAPKFSHQSLGRGKTRLFFLVVLKAHFERLLAKLVCRMGENYHAGSRFFLKDIWP